MKRFGIVCAAVAVMSLGCAGAAVQEGAGEKPAAKKSVKVPVSALPNPGECRIWSPEKSEQGPSGPCADVSIKVKSGDWLMTRGPGSAGEVQVFVYGEIGIVKETFMLDAATGTSK